MINVRTLAFAVSVLVSMSAQGGEVEGLLVGDLTLDAVYLTRDLDGDGVAQSAGETSIYFDASNASGLPGPTTSVFNLHVLANGDVLVADGGTDAVYRLVDVNGDGDAQDAGEARVWFSAENDGGFGLPTPNGIGVDQRGAIYITNAGTGASPNDAIFRTQDLNGDGDANDAGEATVWMDLQAILGGVSAPFDIVFIGDTAYFTDLAGADSDAIMRARDDNGDGVVDAGEFNVFLEEDGPLGIGVGTGLVTDGVGLFISESSASAAQTVYLLTDVNGTGTIDGVEETRLVWTESGVPVGFELGTSFGLAYGPRGGVAGELAVGSAGADIRDNVFRLVDLDEDGTYLGATETLVWVSANTGPGSFVDNARALAYLFASADCPPDLDGNGAVDFGDLLSVLSRWGPCPDCSQDLNGDDLVAFGDLLIVLSAWGPCKP